MPAIGQTTWVNGIGVAGGMLHLMDDGRQVGYPRIALFEMGRKALSDVALVDGPWDRLVSGRILPVVQHGDWIPVPDPAGAAIPMLRELSTVDFGARAPTIADDGTFRPRRADRAARTERRGRALR